MGQRRYTPAASTGSYRHAVIRVSLATLVTIYLLLFLAAVFLFWIVGEWNRRRRERRSLQHRLRCDATGANDLLERMLRLAPAHYFRSVFLARMALNWLQQGEPKRALALVGEALKLKPEA